MDYSTLDTSRLAKLATYTLPQTYHLQENSGNGCFLDPPGYPTYFTQSVYTRKGNNPPRGPYYVIVHPELGMRRLPDLHDDDKREAFYRNLWKPLPLDHPRVVDAKTAWIIDGCIRSATVAETRARHTREDMERYRTELAKGE